MITTSSLTNMEKFTLEEVARLKADFTPKFNGLPQGCNSAVLL